MLIATGHFNSSKRPCIHLTLVGDGGCSTNVEAVVDTGFGGFLHVPPALLSQLGLTFTGTITGTLADGRRWDFRTGLITVSLGGRTETGLGWVGPIPMIGMDFLRQFKVALAIQAGQVALCDAGEFSQRVFANLGDPPTRHSALSFDD